MEATLGLFENTREANVTSTVAMVEDVLIELGHFLNDCREDPLPDGQPSWCVTKGSALVRIHLLERDDAMHLRASSVVMTLREEVDERLLFRRLLSINHEIYGAAFGLVGSQILLSTERTTVDLDRSEVFDLIRRIEDYADYYDDRLVDEFGGILGSGA